MERRGKRKRTGGYKKYLGPDVDPDVEEPRCSVWRSAKRLKVLNSQSEVPSESSLPTVDTHQVASSYGSHSASGQDESWIASTPTVAGRSDTTSYCASDMIPPCQAEVTVMNAAVLAAVINTGVPQTVYDAEMSPPSEDCVATSSVLDSSVISTNTGRNPVPCVVQLLQGPSSCTGLDLTCSQSSNAAAAYTADENASCASLQPDVLSSPASVNRGPVDMQCLPSSPMNLHSSIAVSTLQENVACSSRLDIVPSNSHSSRNSSRSSENDILSHESSDEDVESVGLLEPESEEVDLSSEGEDEHEQDQDQDLHAEDEPHQLPEPAEEDNQPVEGGNEPPGNEEDENPDPPPQNDQGVPLNNFNNVGPGHLKLRRKMEGDYGPIIDTQVNVSRNDALYMALGLAKREKFSNSTLSNSVKLINALFSSPILPATVDSLDGLLLSNQYVKYFFYCVQCMKSFGELDHKNVKTHICPFCRTVNVISDLRKAHFFVMFSIPHQLENLLQNPEIRNALLTPAEAVATERVGFLSDLWHGSMYKNFAAAIVNFLGRIFSFHFYVDGSPLATTSMFSIRPLWLALNELPAKLRMSNLLLGGLWFGPKQACMDLFLAPFVHQFQQLSQGFDIKVGDNIEHCYAFCTGCCVDSGARGKVQGVKTHSGYHSCNWCVVCGQWIGGAVRFPFTIERPRPRNHEELETTQRNLVDNPLPPEDEDEYDEDPGVAEADRELLGVNSVSPLINLPHIRTPMGGSVPSFHMVDAFFVDSMHMVHLGICKFFLTRWMEDYGYEYYIKASEEEINRRIKLLQLPIECRRQPRPLPERARFTAREYQNWMMFESVPVLTGILPNKFLNCWLVLIQALYFLNLNDVDIEKADIADRLIVYFLTKTQEYYQEGDMGFNLHILQHLPAHVLRHGPPWASNAYCFEDANGKLKSIIHSNQGVPHQVIRALCWAEAIKVLEGVVSEKAKKYVRDINEPKQHKKRSFTVGDVRLIGLSEDAEHSPEEFYQCEAFGHNIEANLERYPKLVYRNCCFTDDNNRSIRTDNSIAQLCDKSLVILRKILYDTAQDEVFLLVSNIFFDTVLVPPAGIRIHRDDHFMRKVTHINEEVRCIECSELRTICFRANLPSGDFVGPFPNVQNRQ